MIKRSRTVVPYIGFSNGSRIYSSGRIYRGRAITRPSSGRILRNLWNTIKRFRTAEYGGIEVSFLLNNQVYTTYTDHEGYYTFDFILPNPLTEPYWNQEYLELELKVFEKGYELISIVAKVLLVKKSSRYVIVSDIDDTVMESYVSSPFKLKMLYNTFTKAPFQRKPVVGMASLLASAQFEKSIVPVFYLSNSPWNIYDFINGFLEYHDFPLGPVFLRDYGRQMIVRKKTDPIHKIEMLQIFFKTFKDQKFILFGDSAERDVDYYLSMVKQYPDQVKAIFIRDVGILRNRKRIEKLCKTSKTPIYLNKSALKFKKDFLDLF